MEFTFHGRDNVMKGICGKVVIRFPYLLSLFTDHAFAL